MRDPVAVVRADEVIDVVVHVVDGPGRLDVLDVVAAVVAASLAGVCALGTKHLAWQIPVVADVDHLIAVSTASLEILGHVSAVDATHQILDASLPLEAAD